jgi:iron complex outermembrane receptor protein
VGYFFSFTGIVKPFNDRYLRKILILVMLRSVVLSALLAISFYSFSQGNVTFSGKVTAESESIPGATVHLLNTNYGTATDSEGTFAIANVIPGNYRIQVSAVGYAAVEQSISINEQNSSFNVKLSEATTQLEAVVVTAQKMEEEVQKVPFSISAIPSRQIQQYRIWSSKDITAIAPNLYSSNPGDNRNVTSIRGITSTSYDPSVATYIDGVNQFGLDTYIAQLFDVERIEVLRGPQGTLYGRNAMGGVVNIITKQPTNVTSGFGEVNIGNYGQQRYSLGIRTPLIRNKLFFGASGMYDKSNGFYTNDYNNSHFDKKHSAMGNYYLKYLASSLWSFTLNVKHNENRNNGTFPLASSVEDAFAGPFKVNQNAVATMTDNIFNSSASANYTGSGFNFSSQTTYQSNYRFYQTPIDGDFSPIDGVTIINDYGKKWNKVSVVTQEFKFTSPASTSSPFQWTAGTYLFYQNNPVKQATHFGNDAAYIDPNAQPNSYVQTTATGKSAGMAFFGQATYHITGNLDVIGGLRYDYEHKKQNVLGQYFMDGVSQPLFETRPDTSTTASFHAISPKLGLAYQASNNSNLYLTYSRGFRAGGLTSISADPSQPPLYAYKPEYSNNLEVGMKETFLENRIRLNLAAFYIRANDVQVPTLVLPQAVTVTRNAGELTSKGFEAEFSATPVHGLQFDYNFGYTKATYNTLKLSQNGAEVNLKGNRQLFTPSSTSMLALQYSLNLGTSLDLKFVVRGEWMNIGTQYFNLTNTIRQSSYSLINTRAGFAAKGFELMFWGRNLGNEKYIAYAYDFGAAHLGDPRNYGVTFRKSF